MKYYKSVLYLIALSILVSLNTSCGPVPFTSMGGTSVSVSVVGKSAPKSLRYNDAKTLGPYQIVPFSNEDHYKTEIKAANRGSLVKRFAPTDFILDITYLLLYNKHETPEIFFDTYLLTKHNFQGQRQVNLVHAMHFLRDINVPGDLWQGFSMMFFGIYGGGDHGSNKNISVVAVDLGPSYSGIVLSGEVTNTLSGATPGLHYFSFDSLQPYNTPYLSVLSVGSDFSTAGIQNPSGETGYWTLPGSQSSGNGSAIFMPGSGVDFSGFTNPEILLYWDMQNLVEVYDRNTPSPADDLVVFNLANPFPVQIVVQEQTVNGSTGQDAVPPGEVSFPLVSPLTSCNMLYWVNPKDEDFSKVIIRRTVNIPPSSHADGDIVYDDNDCYYYDTTGISGTHYYYSIYTVDFSGNESPGIVLDHIQN